MKKSVISIFMMMLMVLSSFFLAFKPAVAQTDTTVFFVEDPDTVYLNGSNSEVVEVWVGDVVEMNAFDITVEYDPAVVTLSSWTTGGFLEIGTGNCFPNPQHPNEPGYFQIICTQFAKPLKTGSGVLLKLSFIGLGFDSTTLTLTNPEFSAGTPLVTIYPTPTNGTLNAAYDPTIIKPTTLSGSFELQGRVDRGGIPVTLSEAQFVGQGPYTVPTTNVSGNNLSFPSVVMDVYTVSTGQAGYLNVSPEMGRQIALLASGNVLPPLRLIGGNAVWTGHATSNDQIDIFDVALVSGEIGKISFDPDADINGNGKVDIFDLAMVAGNYGMNSVDAYAGWMQ